MRESPDSPPVEFRLLGAVEAWADGQPVDLGPPKRRLLAALLLLECGQCVPVDRLVELAWEEPPPAARRVVFTHIARLRQALSGAAAHSVELLSTPPGYTLRVNPAWVDVHAFRELARAASATADPRARSDLLHSALRLWRGPALSDLTLAPGAQRLCQRLDDVRLAAVEDRIDADLVLGRHAEIAEELADLVTHHPLRERLAEQLMLTLYRCGRTGEALDAYRRIREAIATELGLDPGPALAALHGAILRRDPSIAAPPEPAPAVATSPAAQPAASPSTPPPTPPPTSPMASGPRQLPPTVSGFTGRDAEIEQLDASLPDATGACAPVVITAITGSAGIGKTAAAVYWAHRVKHRFPDGQLYISLRGYGAGPPVAPLDALSHALRSLGVPANQVPTDLEAATAAYRTILAGRRVLVVLDDARNAEQVRPLLPGDPGCLVVTTSRDRLSGLVVRDGARRLVLDVLAPEDARTLLVQALGSTRVDAEPAAVDRLAALCAYLPLALRIAAGGILDQPAQSIADYVTRLSDGDRLTALQVDDDPQAAVRAAFEVSLVALPGPAQRLFRLLGLVPGPDFTVAGAAALAGMPTDQAARLLDRLAAVHLVNQHGTGRFGCHDLLRLFAAERCAALDSAPERTTALHRLFSYYLDGADAAARRRYPHMQRLPQAARTDPGIAFDTADAALAWLDTERPSLVAAVRYAAEHGPRSMAWLLADALRGYFWLHWHVVDWLAVAESALSAANADGDRLGQALAHLNLAQAMRRGSDEDAAIAHYLRASDLARQAGWREGEAGALASLADLYRTQGRLVDAAEVCQRACDSYAGTDARNGQAASHCNLGHIYTDLGQLHRAADHYERAIEVCTEIGADAGGAIVRASLGALYGLQGRIKDGFAQVERAREVLCGLGSREGQADTESKLAVLHNRAGRYTEAVPLARAAADLAQEIRADHVRVEALNALGTAYERLGQQDGAHDCHVEARELAREVGYRVGEAGALIGLAASALSRGRFAEADRWARDAQVLARGAGLRIHEAQALTILADAARGASRPDEAARSDEQVRAIEREIGHVPPR